MNRRQFLQTIGIGFTSTSVISSTVGFGLLHECWQRLSIWLNGCRCVVVGGKKKLCNKCKGFLISQALKTTEGRAALAQSMVEPIRRSLEYQGLGRKLLLVDELPQGALAHYERDVAAIGRMMRNVG